MEFLDSLVGLLVLLNQRFDFLFSLLLSLFSKLRVPFPSGHLVVNPGQLVAGFEFKAMGVVVEAHAHSLLSLGNGL